MTDDGSRPHLNPGTTVLLIGGGSMLGAIADITKAIEAGGSKLIVVDSLSAAEARAKKSLEPTIIVTPANPETPSIIELKRNILPELVTYDHEPVKEKPNWCHGNNEPWRRKKRK
jgi:NADPH:quinone reductase-like Zn-dependent oxidoreductase